MKITLEKKAVELKKGDVIKSKRTQKYFIVAKEDDGKFILISLSTFEVYSKRYSSLIDMLDDFFSYGYTVFPSDENELLIGGCN